MNKAILMGRLTKDPELRKTGNDTSVCSFTLAVDRRFKNASGQRETDFIPCVAWRQQADFASRYFSKGSRMAVVGSIQPRSWDDNEGKRHYITEVIVDEIYFADSRRDDGGRDSNSYDRSNAQRSSKSSGIPEGDGFLPVDSDDTSLPFDI